jgi:hypothetical protein
MLAICLKLVVTSLSHILGEYRPFKLFEGKGFKGGERLNPNNKKIETVKRGDPSHPVTLLHDAPEQKSTKSAATKTAAKGQGEDKKDPKKEKLKDESQKPLLELNEDNFLKVLEDLGGKNITSAQLWPFFVRKDTKPQERFPVMVRIARKLASQKPPKVAITVNEERKRKQYFISLV